MRKEISINSQDWYELCEALEVALDADLNMIIIKARRLQEIKKYQNKKIWDFEHNYQRKQAIPEAYYYHLVKRKE